MKSQKRFNKRKSSKVTLKAHHKQAHPDHQDVVKRDAGESNEVRPEGIKFHQH